MRVAIICQWFPPELAPIGAMLKELSEDLAFQGHEVTIITGFPNHPAGVLFEGYKKHLVATELYGKVKVVRCYLYTSPKRTFFRRLLNYVTFAAVALVATLRLERQDVLFMISPPLSNGIIAMILGKLRGVRFVFNVQDIYPDAAISAGVIRNPFLVRALQSIEMAIYRAASGISVISEGFKENLVKKGVSAPKIRVLYNWLDTSEVVPLPKDNDFTKEHGLLDKFVVLYSGTIGIVSGADILLSCADNLRSVDDIIFLFVGEGVTKSKIIEGATQLRLPNVKVLPFQPRERLSEVQSCADVSVVTLRRGQGKYSVPSKVLGYMAAARAIVASVDLDSDTSALIREADCGITVDAEDAEGLTGAILQLYRDRKQAEILGKNGRYFIVEHCDRKRVTAEYDRFFRSVCEMT